MSREAISVMGRGLRVDPHKGQPGFKEVGTKVLASAIEIPRLSRNEVTHCT